MNQETIKLVVRSGIGLSIAKSIVELHEGKLWAECEENKVYFYVLIK